MLELGGPPVVSLVREFATSEVHLERWQLGEMALRDWRGPCSVDPTRNEKMGLTRCYPGAWNATFGSGFGVEIRTPER